MEHALFSEEAINLDLYELHDFDLQECRAGHLTTTSDGVIFTFGGFKIGPGRHPLIGWIAGDTVSFSQSGWRRIPTGGGLHRYQFLFMAKKKKIKTKLTKWVILDKHIGYNSQEEAEAHIKSFGRSWKYPPHQIKQITFEIEE